MAYTQGHDSLPLELKRPPSVGDSGAQSLTSSETSESACLEDAMPTSLENTGLNGRSTPKDEIPPERLKTIFFAAYFAACAFTATLNLQVVNQRVEHDQNVTNPLRDLVFDFQERFLRFDSRPELFKITELWGIFMMLSFFTMTFFHKHRLVILRRYAFIVGTMYVYRAGTSLVTSLPVPGWHIVCQAKYNTTTDGAAVVLKQTVKTFSGGGMQMTNDPRLACGGYIFSGHTMIILTSLLFLIRYTPKSWFCGSRFFYNFVVAFCSIMSFLAAGFTVLAHEHYTVDVILAYYFVTRIFWNLHAILDDCGMKREMGKEFVYYRDLERGRFDRERLTTNPMRNYWYVRLLLWSESNVRLEKSNCLPYEFESPVRAFLSLVKDIKNGDFI